MKLQKALRRDRKREKRMKMVVDSRSVFLMEEEARKRAQEIKDKRKIKEELQNA